MEHSKIEIKNTYLFYFMDAQVVIEQCHTAHLSTTGQVNKSEKKKKWEEKRK